MSDQKQNPAIGKTKLIDITYCFNLALLMAIAEMSCPNKKEGVISTTFYYDKFKTYTDATGKTKITEIIPHDLFVILTNAATQLAAELCGCSVSEATFLN